MKLCIIGSKNADPDIAQRYVTELLSVWFTGGDPAAASFGTFLNGAVHSAAADFATHCGSRLIRFHTIEAIIRWKPDHVMIFWDGQSVGCQTCFSRLTRAGLFCQLYLVNPLATRLLGDNTRFQPQVCIDHAHALEFATAGVV